MAAGSGIRVGTASWTDPTLTKESDWYPRRSMTAEERLRFYARRFPVVEVDSTYYYPPTQRLAGLWTERTPDDFRFDVKAYSLLTQHPASADSVWEDVRESILEEHRGKKRVYLTHLPDEAVERAFDNFRDALMPLHSAGKLGAVFFQFPPWFHPGRPAREFLEKLPERLPDYDIAVEFRNASWMGEGDRDRTLRLLRELGLVYTCVDEPQGFDSSIPPVLAATSAELAIVRFHGHNGENWEKKGISPAERYRYLYSDAELKEWASPLRELAGEARETHLIMNNCYRDYGVRNAAELGGLLDVQWDPPEQE